MSRLFACIILFVGVSSVAVGKDAFLKVGGKEIGTADLTPAEQQTLYEIEMERYLKVSAFADDVLVSRYLDAKAKQDGKTREAVEAQLLATKEATDKEAETWFNDNKARLPPHLTFDQVKGEIKTLLRTESVKKKKDELVAAAKKEGAVVLVAEPASPIVTINAQGMPTKGPADAKVKIVEFADYQCPHCKEAGEAIERLIAKRGKDVSLTYVDFPINASGISLVVAHGAACAETQGKFWEYHDLAFAQQRTLTKESPAALAKELKLDEATFKTCMDSDAPKKRVEAGRAEGERLGVAGTPAIYVNGKRIMDHHGDQLDKAVEAALKGTK